MRIPTPIQALSAAAALALLAGCSSGSAIAPHMSTPAGHHVQSMMGHVPAVVGPFAASKINYNTGKHFASFNACPATGTIEYVSDFNNSIISIYKGKFAGQAPCGQITSANGIINPQGLFVDTSDHLWVADTGNGNVLEFKRGNNTAIKTYTDSTNGLNYAVDVTVYKTTVIATNIYNANTFIGSVSTWNKATGALEGNFPNPASAFDYFVTVQKNGTVYMDDNTLSVYSFTCPAGLCTTETSVGATGFNFPGGLRSGPGEDLVLQDQSGSSGGAQLTYESFPGGPAQTCTVDSGADTVAFDMNKLHNHYFAADATNNRAVEVKYPSCAAIGTVPGNASGLPIGAAVDDPESL